MGRKVRAVVSESGEVLGAAGDRFEWRDVPAKDRVWLREATDRVVVLHRRTAEDTVEMGRLIAEAKRRLPHGAYLGWVEAELPFSHDTARRLVTAAEEFGGLELRTVRNFEPTAMYDLAAPSTPPAARERALGVAQQGGKVTRETVREIVAAVRQELPPRNRGDQIAHGQGVYIDRLEAAIEDGRIELVDTGDYRPLDTMPLTTGMLGLLQRILFPENYPDEPAARAVPTGTAPGSEGRVAVYAERRKRGLPLCDDRDADPERDGRALAIERRSGGAGRVTDAGRLPPPPKVLGWADEVRGRKAA